MKEALFTPDELRRLERLHIRRRRSVRGVSQGEWRSRRHGTSGLFADHRPYAEGDDLRYVDWNVYGRLGDLVVKRFEAEESAELLLALDRSPSMEGAKSRAARRLAGALGYLALTHLDHVRLSWLPLPDDRPPLEAFRSRGRAASFLDALVAVDHGGATDHARDLARILGATRRRGLAILVSDFFDQNGAIRGLALLRARGLEVGALHVVDPADARLPVGSSVLAVDRETGETLAVDVSPAVAARVHRAWTAGLHGLERWCVSREIPYLRVDARRDVWDVLRELLRQRLALTG